MSFIPEGNEPKSRVSASMGPWRMPRGSNTRVSKGHLVFDLISIEHFGAVFIDI